MCRGSGSWPPPMLPESCQATSQHSFMSISRQPRTLPKLASRWGPAANKPVTQSIVSALRCSTARRHHQTLRIRPIRSLPFPDRAAEGKRDVLAHGQRLGGLLVDMLNKTSTLGI